MKSTILALFSTAVLALVPSLASASAYQQVYLSFSGGSGTPLTITVGTPISFRADIGASSYALAIDEIGAGTQVFLNPGTFAFTINGIGSNDITKLSYYYDNIGDLTEQDGFFSSADAPPVSIGDRLDFSTGTVTSMSNYFAAAPVSGYYNAFLINASGLIMGSAIPEPSTYATIAGVIVLGGVALRRRRARA